MVKKTRRKKSKNDFKINDRVFFIEQPNYQMYYCRIIGINGNKYQLRCRNRSIGASREIVEKEKTKSQIHPIICRIDNHTPIK